MKILVALVLLLATYGAFAEPRLRPQSWAQPVIGTQLENLYLVDNGVYRSRQPDEEDAADLAALGIRQILNLREYHSDGGEVDPAHFALSRVPMSAGSVSEQQLIEALRVISEREGPILIHCWHGSDRTGVTVAAYRLVFNGWSKAQALDEMINGGYGYHAMMYPNLQALLNGLDIVRMRAALGMGPQ